MKKKMLMLLLSLALTGGLAQAQKDKDKDKDDKAKTTQAAPEGSAKEEAAEKSVHITSGPTVANLTRTSATLQWTTNKNAANDVHYSCGGKDKVAYAKGGSTNHAVTLSGLKPGSTCTWKIMTREKEVRQEGQFQTPAK
jgi:2-oxoglutarate dehydrogenase complex dehydrogenase (E1) component-like enzyme